MMVKFLILLVLALFFCFRIETRLPNRLVVNVEISTTQHLTEKHWVENTHHVLEPNNQQYVEPVSEDDSYAETDAALNADEQSIGFRKRRNQQQAAAAAPTPAPTPATDTAAQQVSRVEEARKEAEAAKQRRIAEQQAEIEKHKQDLANANPLHAKLQSVSDQQLKVMLGLLIQQQHLTYEAPPPDPLPALSMDYRAHKTVDDCWQRINGEVYVLTNFVHSGLQSFITNNCGKDATIAYKNQHGDNPSLLQKIARFKVRALSPTQDCTDGTHSVPTDCWVQVKDEIYDLSNFLHPGGPSYVVRHCGGEGTNDFMRQHGAGYIARLAQYKLTPEQIAAGSKNTCHKS